MFYRYLYGLLIVFFLSCEAKVPDLTSSTVTSKVKEIMKSHASQKKLTPVLVERILNNYLEELDPNKTYFIESDIDQWLHPSNELIEQIIQDYNQGLFPVFEEMQNTFVKAIQRRRVLEQQINYQDLPSHVNVQEFKDVKWTKNDQELFNRIERQKALQIETASKLNENMREKSLQRIAKRQTKLEEEMLSIDPKERQKLILSNILKATAAALDAHTAYFTPEEASQFMINVQQRLHGIGAQLRDDINGFTITKIVEGGPASLNKDIQVKDRIIAVDGEPVVGMDIADAVELIRGEANTPVVLTLIRETVEPDGSKQEKKLDVTVLRGEVVLKETRYKTSFDPYGDGVIGYIRLYSFYQDRDSSSASDLEAEINRLKREHNLQGLILDLRYNTGGLLAQAVDVTGLFITKGIVVSIKDENGKIQHLRHVDGQVTWDGPLLILTNRSSASASEIVAQTLQDYGRALIVGDDHTFGKGSYQTFTLSTVADGGVNSQGEYKVTRGRYYTVSGKTPQLTGVLSDVVVPGPLSETDIGERFAKYPLENDHIKANFDDDLADIPFLKREQIKRAYKFDLQEKLETYQPYIEKLKQNSKIRLDHSKNYQNLIKELKKKEDFDVERMEPFGQNDLQLEEAYQIMKDLILLMHEKGLSWPSKRKEMLTLHDTSNPDESPAKEAAY